MHQILLHKLHNIGIRGKLFDWIADFLKNQMQCVQVDGCSSIFELVLFYVNDLEKAARDALSSHAYFCR